MKVRILGQSQQFNEDAADLAAIDLGNGLGALLMITATISKTTVTAQGASAGSLLLLAANTAPGGRKAAIIANNGSTTLHVTVQAGTLNAAVEDVVPPGSSWDSPEIYQGAIWGWWEGTPTGSATVSEVV